MSILYTDTDKTGIPINGKEMANNIYNCLKDIITEDKLNSYNNQMNLVIVTTGDSVAGEVYVRSKINKCKELGIVPCVQHYDFFNDDDNS